MHTFLRVGLWSTMGLTSECIAHKTAYNWAARKQNYLVTSVSLHLPKANIDYG